MHNVISSCFFPSGELCLAEGGGWLYVGGGGRGAVVVGAERLFCCVFFLLTFCFSQFLTFLTFS